MARRAAHVRLVLLLHAAAMAVAASALLLAAGLPLAARGALSPHAFLAAVVGAAAASFALGAALLFRTVARPVERLFAAAERLADPWGLPLLGEPGGAALSRASLAFERLAGELAQERVRLASKVEELTRANRALAEARESLLRTEKLATVGRLAAGVAHEVGNPLGAIAGYVDLAQARMREGRPGDAEDYLGRVAAEVQRIDGTVRELLDFARPTGLSLAAVDLAAALDGSLRLARVQARFREVEVELDLPADLPRVVADERGLAQVLLNLFLNAGDAMGGKGALRVSARPADGALVVLDVADAGPGIAPSDLPKIFDPFFTTKEPGKGAGLGLAISHRIVESFGGEIAAANGPGGGAVFTVAFQEAAAPARKEGDGEGSA